MVPEKVNYKIDLFRGPEQVSVVEFCQFGISVYYHFCRGTSHVKTVGTTMLKSFNIKVPENSI